MFKVFLATLLLVVGLGLNNLVQAQEAVEPASLGFGSVEATETLPTTTTDLSFDEEIGTIEDPTAYTGDPDDYSLGTVDGGGGGDGGGSASSISATSAAGTAAVQEFVEPTNTGYFSLSNLNSDNEAALYVGNDNGENNIVFRAIRLIAMLVGTLAILLYIVAGYFMIFSMGDENSLTKGKQIATYTSLGLVLAFTAYMIVQLVLGLMYFAA